MTDSIPTFISTLRRKFSEYGRVHSVSVSAHQDFSGIDPKRVKHAAEVSVFVEGQREMERIQNLWVFNPWSVVLLSIKPQQDGGYAVSVKLSHWSRIETQQ